MNLYRIGSSISSGNIGEVGGTLLKTVASAGIYGVGRWTAEYTAMIGFNRCDIVPAADIGLQRAVQKCYKLSQRPSEDGIRKAVSTLVNDLQLQKHYVNPIGKIMIQNDQTYY